MTLNAHSLPNKGASDVWLTPPEIIAALGEFDLDPCAACPRPWPTARNHLCEHHDGLAWDWMPGYRVWLNPPFSQAEAFLSRLVEHAERGGSGIALLAARTETRVWHELVWPKCSGVLFLRKRPHFHRLDGSRAPFNSGAPIALIAYGEREAAALRDCGLDGAFVRAEARESA